MQLLKWLDSVDTWLLLLVNRSGTRLLDPAMYLVSTGWFWTPLFLFLGWKALRRYRMIGDRLLVVAAVALCLTGTDLIVGKVIKPGVGRIRPTHRADLIPQLRPVTDLKGHQFHGGRHCFVSSHAANFFGVAMIAYLLLGRRRWAWLFAWAALVSASRVYVGVHFPGDVLGGALFGVGWAALVWKIVRRVRPTALS